MPLSPTTPDLLAVALGFPLAVSPLRCLYKKQDIITLPTITAMRFCVLQEMTKFFLGFEQPFEHSEFERLVKSQALSLERVSFDDNNQGACSMVAYARVDNRGFEKNVYARVTEDGWHTFKDVQAYYMSSNVDSNTDNFKFVFQLSGQEAEFSLCYEVNGEIFWDNNREKNYAITTVKVLPPVQL